MDDGLGLGAGLAEGEHMGHHVVPDLVLMRRGGGIVDVVNVLAHLLNLLVADGDAQLLLRLRQRDPQLAPGGKLVVVGKQTLHFVVGVSAAQGVLVKFVHARSLPYL